MKPATKKSTTKLRVLAALYSKDRKVVILEFIKKRKDKKDVGDPWTIAEGNEDGLPVLYRLRGCVPDGISISKYPYLLSILWHYETKEESGMPSKDTNEQQLAFDDALDEMDNTGQGTLMLVVTGNGRREWIWYVSNPQDWLASLHTCLVGHPVYPLDIQQSEDSEWNTWKTFRDSFK